MARADDVSVIVCDGPRYDIHGSLRQEWIQKIFPQVRVYLVEEQHADDDSEGWAARTRDVLGFIPDKVFTSEAYGDSYARWLGCEHVSFDPARAQVHVSGTMVRRDPYAHWADLHPLVRAYYVKRVALVGAESCGKSTLAAKLARSFRTYVVPEYGRYYWDAKQYAGDDPVWMTEEFVHIAAKQNELEDHFATRANKVLLCDTNAFLTGIWHRRYLGYDAPEVESLSAGRRYDLVLFFPANIPFVQDGTRDGEVIRPEMSDWIRQKLEATGTAFTTMTGTVEQRTEFAAGLIRQLFD
jgi:NadR type nicotinamide-nucleotide adenylyltransferase